MSFLKSVYVKYREFMFEHEKIRNGKDYTIALVVISFSAFLFAFGYKCFLAPEIIVNSAKPTGIRLVSGGVSGIAQTIIMAISLTPGNTLDASGFSSTLYSILYFGLNVPVILLAFFGIGKRFTLYTLVDVAEVSLWIWILSFWDDGWVGQLAQFAYENGGMLSRAIFAGAITGLSSAIAYKVDGSAGGIDVVAYFIALKKSKLVGRYSLVLNAVIVVCFTIIGTTKLQAGLETPLSENIGNTQYLGGAMFSIIYMFTSVLIVDIINVRNKKIQVEVVTDNEDLVNVIIANIAHGATVEKGFGAFTHKEKTIIQIVISSYEEKETIRLIKEADPNAFVKTVELRQVYGKFYIPPIK